MDDLFKSVKFFILLGYLAVMTFLGVLYFDKPVHRDFAVYMNEICIGSTMQKISAGIGNNNREVLLRLVAEPVRGYCDCFMPSPNNQMTYMKFVGNYWENISLSLNLGGKTSDLKAVRGCAAEFKAAVALASQYE